MGYKRNHVSLIHGNTESHEPSCGICTKTYDYAENTLFQWGHWFFQISLGWEFPNFIGDGISKPVFPNFKCGGGII